jgi:hypothetical protein
MKSRVIACRRVQVVKGDDTVNQTLMTPEYLNQTWQAGEATLAEWSFSGWKYVLTLTEGPLAGRQYRVRFEDEDGPNFHPPTGF